jgi:hypothetical protein
MVQTITLMILLLAGAAFVQANISAIHSPIALTIPGMTGVHLTYLRLLAAMGGALVLLWITGLIDFETQRTRVRRREAMILVKDRELMRVKSVAYDQQQPALADTTARLETVVREVRTTLNRVDPSLSANPQRVIRQEVVASVPDRALREEVATARSEPIIRSRADEQVIRKEVVTVDENPIARENAVTKKKEWWRLSAR